MNAPYQGKFRVSQVYSASHDGLDLVGVDSKNIYSTVAGTVERAGWENASNHNQGFGLYVRIKESGSADRYYFGHMSEVKAKVGDTVSVGTLLGVEGSTGYSTGSHCHYGCRTDADKTKVKNISDISGIPNVLGTYTSSGSTGTSAVDVIYRVRTKKDGWLPEVKNLGNYAGWEDSPVTDVAVKVTQGSVKYRVHVKGGDWLPYVTGYDINDSKNGYAGNNTPIDAVEIYYTTPSGQTVKKAKYRVAPVGGDYYSWQLDNEKTNGQDGYAGMLGKSIGKLQVVIE